MSRRRTTYPIRTRISAARPAMFTVGLLVTCTAGCTVASRSWTEIAFGDVLTFRSPVVLTPTGGTGIDSQVGQWEGPGLNVLIDYSPFADPLASRAGQTGLRLLTETIDGRAARIASSAKAGSGRRVAVHFPELERHITAGPPAKLTMVVESDSILDEDALLAIVRSVTFTEREAAPSDSS